MTKRFAAALLAATLLFTACAAYASTNFTPAEKVVVADPAYNDMGADELYELALKETGTITIYSQTSLIAKVIDTFNAAYPGLKVEYYEYGTGESQEKMIQEYETGNQTGDVILADDGTGVWYNEFYEYGYVQAYYPTDVVTHIADSDLTYGLPVYDALNIWFWNNSQFDECPIKSWWDVLDTKEDGSYVYKLYIAGPSKSAGSAVFANLSLYSAELEASYLEKYGTPLEYTYDASVLNVEPNNAAYEFLYRLAQANYTIIGDGNDIVDAVGRSTETCLGFCTANKLNVAQSNNLPVAWVIDLEPYASMHNAKYLYYVTDSDNPAGARLLMYYLMGGKDGNNDAIKTFARVGLWFLRDDTIDPAADVNIPISQIVTVPQNMDAIYERMGSIADFWVYWADKFAK